MSGRRRDVPTMWLDAASSPYGVGPGDDIAWMPAGATIHVVPGRASPGALAREERLKLFDRATERCRRRGADHRARAEALLRRGIEDASLRIAHQGIVEFVAATTRPRRDAASILSAADARLEAEDLLRQFEVLYPDADVIRTALWGMAAYGLSWFDAHMWAYAEARGLDLLYLEDFPHDRWYGRVRVVNPFLPAA